MDLQTRKLNLIAYLAQLKDESFFDKIENYILKKQSKEPNSTLEPFTAEELRSRIEKSEQDLQNGKYKTQEELEEISAKW